jgi:polysaccharide pyruvyl transferase WcaK-like protein
MNRREFLTASLAGSLLAGRAVTQEAKPLKILLVSAWQSVNIGDIAHTPGMLALLEKYRPRDEVTLWPRVMDASVEALLLKRFPKLKMVRTKADQQAALENCDFFLHGSGPGLVGKAEAEMAQKAGKPYGFGGVTLSDDEIKNQRDLLSGARFVFCRDTDSLAALRAAGIKNPRKEFGPDATFALDLRDDEVAKKLLDSYQLEAGKFMCIVPRLRWTPYWEIRPTVKPNPERSAVNEAFAERDHAKQREAIIAWVRETKQRVLLCPEMTYAVVRLKPLLFDPLPDDVKPLVSVMDRYWLTAEAASVYAQAALILSMEMHSPIMAVANGTPAMLLRQPTDTRKGQMWRDVGLKEWIFEIDDTTGKQVAERTLEIAKNLPAARETAKKAREVARKAMEAMVGAIG